MTPQKYQLSTPTIAMYLENGTHVAMTVPAGSVVTVDSETFNGDKLVQALWTNKSVMMFTQDIRLRGVKVE